jgi:hypothetical protein
LRGPVNPGENSGASHGMCTTLKEQVNTDLLEFLKS